MTDASGSNGNENLARSGRWSINCSLGEGFADCRYLNRFHNGRWSVDLSQVHIEALALAELIVQGDDHTELGPA